MAKKVSKEEARNILRHKGISFKDNFHTLSPSKVSDIVDVADMMHYRKPKNASGSRGRYFFAYLQSARGE